MGDTASDTQGKVFYDNVGDYMSLHTNGSERLLIDSSGNVGIGTSSPVGMLEITNANPLIYQSFRSSRADGNDYTVGGFDSLFRTRDANVNTGAFIRVLDVNTNPSFPTTIRGGVLSFGTVDGASGSFTDAEERMRIDSSGNVGIGTSSPTDTLSVGTLGSGTPTITIGSGTANSGYLYFGDGTGTDRYRGYLQYQHSTDSLQFGSAGSERLRIDSSGNVGVGVTSPLSKFHVYQSTAGSDAAFIRTNSGAGQNNTAITNTHFVGGDTSNVRNTVLRVQTIRSDTGDNRQAVLQVEDYGSTARGLKLDADRLIFAEHSGSNTDLSILAKSGYLYALGGTAGAILADDANQSNRILLSNSGNYVKFDTSGTERMRILSGGVLCVGTTSANSSATFETITAQRTMIQGGSDDAASPTVHISDADGSVEANSTILSLGFDADSSFANANYIRFIDQTAEQGVIEGAGAGSVSYTTSSDKRRKENVEDAPDYLEKIKQIEVKKYNFIGSKKKEIGMLAQDLYEIIPEPVRVGGDNEHSNPWGIDYGKLTPFLVKAIQEQQTLIEQLQAEVALLKGE